MSTALSGDRTAPASTAHRSFWILLWALYTTQFIGASFLSTGLTGILRDGGADLSTLGLLQLLGLVWPLKFLWASLLDRWSPRAASGHYRTWLLILQSLMVLSLLGLALVADPVQGLGTVVILAGAFVLFSATQDIAADALSVRGLDSAQHNKGAGIQVAASYLGTLVGGGLALLVYDLWGWRAAVLTLVFFTALALATVARYVEPPRAPRSSSRITFKDMFGVLSQPGARTWALVAVPLIALGSGALWSLVTPALVDAGWSLTRIGVVTSVVASVPALAAALAGGRMCRRWGRATTMLLGAGIQLIGGLSFIPVITTLWPVGGGLELAFGVLGTSCVLAGYTIMNTGIYAVNLGLARTENPGGDFTLLTSISMLGGTVGAWAGLTIAAYSNYGVALAVGLACAGLGIAVSRRGVRLAR